jgi:DNA-binding IclR family transcriptional regulator
MNRLVGCPTHVCVYLDAVRHLATNPAIQGEAWRVLLLLLSVLDDDNKVVMHSAQVAALLHVPRQSVWRALTTLGETSIVRRGPQGMPGLYQVSQQLARRCHVTSEERPQRSYVRLWQTTAWRQLAADKTLHTSDWRVLGKVLAEMQWLNVVHLSPPQWGQELGMARQTVWRVLQGLLTRGVLFPDFRSRPDHYVLSYTYGYRGAMRYLSLMRRQEHAVQQLQRLADEA